MFSRRGESGRMRGYPGNQRICSSGATSLEYRNPKSGNWPSERFGHALWQNGRREKGLNSLELIQLKPSLRPHLISPSSGRAKSGSNPWLIASVIHSNRRRSTHGDTVVRNNCVRRLTSTMQHVTRRSRILPILKPARVLAKDKLPTKYLAGACGSRNNNATN